MVNFKGFGCRKIVTLPQMADWLPDNWQVRIATRKGGTTSEVI